MRINRRELEIYPRESRPFYGQSYEKLWALCVILLLVFSFPPSYDDGMEGTIEVQETSNIDLESVEPGDMPSLTLDGAWTHFKENRGQLSNDKIRFSIDGQGLSLGFHDDGVTFIVWTGTEYEQKSMEDMGNDHDVSIFELEFIGSNQAIPKGEGSRIGPFHHISGNGPTTDAIGVMRYSELLYTNIYDGIDLRYYIKEGKLKYDFDLKPGADCSDILMRYSGVESLSIEPTTGDLMISTRVGIIRDDCPSFRLEEDDTKMWVPCSFVLFNNNEWGFSLPQKVPSGNGLTIDPGLQHFTYLGGKTWEWIYSVCLDSNGDVIVGGETTSTDFPITHDIDNFTNRLRMPFVARFDSTLSTLKHCTIFGNRLQLRTEIEQILPTGNGNIAIVGEDQSGHFNTSTDAFQNSSAGGWDIFIGVMRQDGTSFEYLSYFGGRDDERLRDAMFGPDGSLYLGGYTYSDDLPITPDALQSEYEGQADWFITRFSPNLTTMIASTYLGSPNGDFLINIDIDSNGDVYIAGETDSNEFPTTLGAFCETSSSDGWWAILTRLNSSLQLLYSTFLDGEENSYGLHPYSLGDGKVLLAGGCYDGGGLPVTHDAFDSTFNGSQDAAIGLFDTNTGALDYLSYFGGDGDEALWGAAFDRSRGVVTLCGITTSEDMPWTTGCYDPGLSEAPNKFFLLNFDINRLDVVYCSYLGGWDKTAVVYSSMPNIITTDDDGLIYGVGWTASDNMPVIEGAYCTTKSLGIDGIVFVIDPRPVSKPLSPTGLQLDAGDGFINISWDPIEAENYVVIEYVVFMGTSRDDMTEVARSAGSTWFNKTGLENGKTYFITVAAVNSAGIGTKADPGSATPMGLPSKPLDVVGTSGDGKVHLSWTAPMRDGGGLLGYKVMRGKSPTLMDLVVMVDTGHSYVDDDDRLIMGDTYYYVIVAFNQVGNGYESEVLPVTVYSPPTPPLDLAAEPGDAFIDLSWKRPEITGAKRLLIYRIFRGMNPDELVHLNDVISTVTTYSDDDGLVNGQTYWYAVYAANEHVNGNLSDPVSAIPVGPPSEPVDLIATAGNEKVILAWSKPLTDGGLDITSYIVYSGKTPDKLQMVVEVSNVEFATITGLDNAVTYYFGVTAVNSRDEGRTSSVIEATPLLIPTTPGEFDANSSKDGILLSWEDNPYTDLTGPVTYIILRGIGENSLDHLAAVTNTTSFLDDDPKKGTQYFYRLYSINLNWEESPPTATLKVLMPDVPGRVGDLEAEAGDARVVLAWSPPSNDGGSLVIGYLIYKGMSDSDMVLLEAVSSAGNFTDTDVENGLTYHYCVVAENMMGQGLPSNTISSTPEESVEPKPPNGDESQGIPFFVWIVIVLIIVIGLLLLVLTRRRKYSD